MAARDPGEPHRASTPLELLFDLCFVVAIAQTASRLHHGLAEGHFAEAALAYIPVFFAIWWAWMNFTWFASAYDVDDLPYRLKVFVQIAGVLVLAAGVRRAFDRGDFTIVTAGYCVMRIGLVAQWLRAARADPAHRPTALRYVVGLVAVQAGWLGLLALPAGWWMAGWLVLAPAEVLVPIWAEHVRKTTWHPRHLAERYGLFTLIVLGESVLASTGAVQVAIDAGDLDAELVVVIVGALIILFASWWLYFDRKAYRVVDWRRSPFLWGYGHFVIFAATAAVGAGIGVSADFAAGRAQLSAAAAGATVAVPVALYVLAVWAVEVLPIERGLVAKLAWPVTAGLVLAAAMSSVPVLVIGVLLSVLAALSRGRA